MKHTNAYKQIWRKCGNGYDCDFQVFLGQKYGYRPIPTIILASELILLKETLVSMGVDVHLLDLWYKKDTNAVPHIFILQPISSILINFNNKVSF